MAKSRVVPLKQITVPRLELQSAVEAVKLSSIIKAELKVNIEKEFFWSDSAIALGYIKNSEARYHMFVANRVEVIRKNSGGEHWFHVPGKENPADILSRGASLLELLQSTWWSGPEFLRNLDIAVYLDDKTGNETKAVNDPEIKKLKNILSTNINVDSLALCFERFSSWSRLVKAIANARKMLSARSLSKPELLPADTLQAEIIIIKLAQSQEWSADIKQLSKSKEVHKGSSLLKLRPYLDEDGLLRVGGRVKYSLALTDNEKHPILIPKASAIAKLLVTHFHKKIHHQGLTTTVGAIRGAGYWITGASKLVGSVIYKCV
ncbi:uncharacterized protein [Watersipora subatra]|uniref:uncharacterized protein n=1 Tax=Watersipora subatra TaxID=2589382 RepID=UPI00355C651E